VSDQNQPPEEGEPSSGGRYSANNTDKDGNYIVGKNRTPESTRFRKGDGRKRGRRGKGNRNFATILEQELFSTVTIIENGQTKKVTKLQSIVKRQLDNAGRGQNAAIQLLYTYALPLLEAETRRGEGGIDQDDLAIIRRHMERELNLPSGDEPLEADPPAVPEGPSDGQ